MSSRRSSEHSLTDTDIYVQSKASKTPIQSPYHPNHETVKCHSEANSATVLTTSSTNQIPSTSNKCIALDGSKLINASNTKSYETLTSDHSLIQFEIPVHHPENTTKSHTSEGDLQVDARINRGHIHLSHGNEQNESDNAIFQHNYEGEFKSQSKRGTSEEDMSW